jgi:hypothetical protein
MARESYSIASTVNRIGQRNAWSLRSSVWVEEMYRELTSRLRCRAELEGRLEDSGGPGSPTSVASYRWQKQLSRALQDTDCPRDYEFATHRYTRPPCAPVHTATIVCHVSRRNYA